MSSDVCLETAAPKQWETRAQRGSVASCSAGMPGAPALGNGFPPRPVGPYLVLFIVFVFVCLLCLLLIVATNASVISTIYQP